MQNWKTPVLLLSILSLLITGFSVVAVGIKKNWDSPPPTRVYQFKSVDKKTLPPKEDQLHPQHKTIKAPSLSASNSVLVLIDYQPHILAGVTSRSHKTIRWNATALIRSAVHFKIPIILSHVRSGIYSTKPFLQEIKKYAPNAIVIDRANVNAWKEPQFVAAIKATGRKKIIMAGLWTNTRLAYPAIDARLAGYQVYVSEDAAGCRTPSAHSSGMKRMVQAGVIPITWNVVLTELHRNHVGPNKGKEVTYLFSKYLYKKKSW